MRCLKTKRLPSTNDWNRDITRKVTLAKTPHAYYRSHLSAARVDSSGAYVKRRRQKNACIHSANWNELSRGETHLIRILQKQPKLEPFGTSLAYDIVISYLIARAQSPSWLATLFLLLQRGLFFGRRPGPSYLDGVSGEDAAHSRTCGARAADALSDTYI